MAFFHSLILKIPIPPKRLVSFLLSFLVTSCYFYRNNAKDSSPRLIDKESLLTDRTEHDQILRLFWTSRAPARYKIEISPLGENNWSQVASGISEEFRLSHLVKLKLSDPQKTYKLKLLVINEKSQDKEFEILEFGETDWLTRSRDLQIIRIDLTTRTGEAYLSRSDDSGTLDSLYIYPPPKLVCGKDFQKTFWTAEKKPFDRMKLSSQMSSFKLTRIALKD